MADHDDEPTYGLVMPFTVVASKGGPYDDESYAVGWEAGALDARLEYAKPLHASLPIHEANLPQIDLIAMKHNYTIKVTPEEHGWVYVQLVRG